DSAADHTQPGMSCLGAATFSGDNTQTDIACLGATIFSADHTQTGIACLGATTFSADNTQTGIACLGAAYLMRIIQRHACKASPVSRPAFSLHPSAPAQIPAPTARHNAGGASQYDQCASGRYPAALPAHGAWARR